MNNIKIFTEIGWGNPHFISTEVEKGDHEKRVRGCRRMLVTGIYIRLWLGRNVFILSTANGFEIVRKEKNSFKFLLGFQGVKRSGKKS